MAHPTRAELASDIVALRHLSPQTLSSLQSSNTSTATSQPKRSALELLDTYTPSGGDHEASQGLSKAYIRDMRQNVLKMDRGEGDRLGGRIDAVRENGEQIKRALDEVKL